MLAIGVAAAVLVAGRGGSSGARRAIPTPTTAPSTAATTRATATRPSRRRATPTVAVRPNVSVEARSISWRTGDAGCSVSYSLVNDSRAKAPGTETRVSFAVGGGRQVLVRAVEPEELAAGQRSVGNATVPPYPGSRRGPPCNRLTEIVVAADPEDVLEESDERDNRASVGTGGQANGPRGIYYAPDDTRRR